RSSCTRFSKKIEVFILFPLGGFALRDAVLVQPLPVAAELVALQLQVVIDEYVAELAAIERARFERIERLVEASRQQRPVGGVRVIVAWSQRQLALDAVQASHDLRRDIQ